MTASRDSKMMNIGPKSAAWLRQVGIRTREDLVKAGSVGAFAKIKRAGFRPSLNLLYALEGALLECHWQQLPEDRRSELLLAAEDAVSQLPNPKARAAGKVVEMSGEQFEAEQQASEDEETAALSFDDGHASGGRRDDD